MLDPVPGRGHPGTEPAAGRSHRRHHLIGRGVADGVEAGLQPRLGALHDVLGELVGLEAQVAGWCRHRGSADACRRCASRSSRRRTGRRRPRSHRARGRWPPRAARPSSRTPRAAPDPGRPAPATPPDPRRWRSPVRPSRAPPPRRARPPAAGPPGAARRVGRADRGQRQLPDGMVGLLGQAPARVVSVETGQLGHRRHQRGRRHRRMRVGAGQVHRAAVAGPVQLGRRRGSPLRPAGLVPARAQHRPSARPGGMVPDGGQQLGEAGAAGQFQAGQRQPGAGRVKVRVDEGRRHQRAGQLHGPVGRQATRGRLVTDPADPLAVHQQRAGARRPRAVDPSVAQQGQHVQSVPADAEEAGSTIGHQSAGPVVPVAIRCCKDFQEGCGCQRVSRTSPN